MADNLPPYPPDEPSGDEAEQSSPPEVTIERAEMLLAGGTITHLPHAVLWGSNYSALVHITDPDLQATAVYKPQRGERPLWDFPNGTLCYREVATYQLSHTLGWNLVPPTVLREGPHGLGSLQLFIDHDPETTYFDLDDAFEPQLRQFALFDALANNADRKGGHLLLDPHGKLWGIDHGLTFHAHPKLRTVIWEFAGEQVVQTLLDDLQTLCEQLETLDSPLMQELTTLLSAQEIAALRHRTQQLLEHKRYPLPGPGPNHPWPPV